MAALVEVTAGSSTFPASSTRYSPLGETCIIVNTAESAAQCKRELAGTFSILYARASANSLTGACTFTFRKNTAAGNQTLGIPGSTTGDFQDAVHTDTVAVGDLVAVQVVSGAGTTITPAEISVLFSANAGTAKRFMQSGAIPSATTLKMLPIVGGSTSSTATDVAVSFQVGIASTLRNLFVNVATNTNTLSTSITSRVNAAPGNLSVSVPTTATGVFEDLVNSDALVSGSLINYGFNGGVGSGTCTFKVAGDLSTVTNQNHFVAGGLGTSSLTTQAANLTRWYPVGGNLQVYTTEAQAEVLSQALMSLSGLIIRVVTNTVTATSTLRLRMNSGAANQTLSIGSGATGLFQDSTNTDVTGTSDYLDYQLVTGATGTSLLMCTIGMTAENISFVPPNTEPRPVLMPLLVQ